MRVNVHMDMSDRIFGYMFEAKFPFEYEDEAILHRGLALLNFADHEEDALAEQGWEMYRQLLREANNFLIQTLPASSPSATEDIVNHMMEEEYDEEYQAECENDVLRQLFADIGHYRDELKRTKYNSNGYWEYTNKLCELYSQLLRFDYDTCEEILFDCDAAFVAEWEEEKEKKGESKRTNLEEVKHLTTAFIRCFPIEPCDRFGSVNHPIATHIVMPNPENPVYGGEKSHEAVKKWSQENKVVFSLDNPKEREEWFVLIDKQIYAAESLADIYKNIIRGNWLDSWEHYAKEQLSFSDRVIISKAYEDHMTLVKKERDRLFPRY